MTPCQQIPRFNHNYTLIATYCTYYTLFLGTTYDIEYFYFLALILYFYGRDPINSMESSPFFWFSSSFFFT